MSASRRRGTEDEMAKARALIAQARDVSGLTWLMFAERLGEKDGGRNLQEWVAENPNRSGVPRRALVFAAFALPLSGDDRLLLFRLAGMEGLLDVARGSRALNPSITLEDAATAIGALSGTPGSDVFGRARLLEDAAFEADFHGDWEHAYTLLRAAEIAYGPASSNAPRMVVRAADMLLKLGDYQGVDALLACLDRDYFGRKGSGGSIADPFTLALAGLLRAQVALHRADYAEALRRALAALDVRDYGEVRLEEAWHLAGRAYAGLAQQCRVRRNELIYLSLSAFRKAIEHHRKSGAGSALGYDYLRMAYLGDGFGKEIDVAREMLSGGLGAFHLSIFDASHDASMRIRRNAADAALGATSRLRYRRGIARTLYLLASMEAAGRTRRERLSSAYSYATAYLAFPMNANPQVALVLDELDSVLTEAKDGLGRAGSRRWIDQFETDLQNRSGRFELLSEMKGDPRAGEEELMKRIRSRLLTFGGPESVRIPSPCPMAALGCSLCGGPLRAA